MSAIGRFYERVWSENILYSALLELTYRCNLDCFFCYNDLSLKGRALSTKQYVDLLAQLYELGTMNVTFTGGEPLTHRDFFLLGSKAREYGFAVKVKTNGHALTGKLARRLKSEVDPFHVEVSLHGARSDTHDRQTRVKGSFQRLMTNIPEMLSAGLRVRVNSTLTAWNEREIGDMYELADKLGVVLSFNPQVTPRDDGDKEPLSVAPSSDAVRRLYQLQKARIATNRPGTETGRSNTKGASFGKDDYQASQGREKRQSTASKHCGTGSFGVTIDPYGNVYPCVQWRRAVGNLHRQTLREIWTTSPQLEEVRRTGSDVKQFVDGLGVAGSKIGFCPALALQSTGSPVKLYPGAAQRLYIRKREIDDDIDGENSSNIS